MRIAVQLAAFCTTFIILIHLPETGRACNLPALSGAEWVPHVEIYRNLIILLIFFQVSFFFWTKLGLFLLFFPAFIFLSLIAHIYFPSLKMTCIS